MKGYHTRNGYMGYVNGKYILFALTVMNNYMHISKKFLTARSDKMLP